MDSFRHFADQCAAVALPLGLSVLGGVVKWARGERGTVAALAVSVVTAGFVGLLAHFALEGSSLAEGTKACLIGISGYAGGDILQVASKRVCTIAGTWGGK